jgi:hypothetical protein
MINHLRVKEVIEQIQNQLIAKKITERKTK